MRVENIENKIKEDVVDQFGLSVLAGFIQPNGLFSPCELLKGLESGLPISQLSRAGDLVFICFTEDVLLYEVSLTSDNRIVVTPVQTRTRQITIKKGRFVLFSYDDWSYFMWVGDISVLV